MPVTMKSSSTSNLKPTPSKPKTIQDVDESVQHMDKINRTSFYNWLRDSTHLDQIAMHCKRILKDFECDEIALGLCWLTQAWTASRTAELLIKMFYHWGMASDKFAMIVRSMLDHHYVKNDATANAKADDILMTLLIGEDPQLTSKFLHLVTSGWTPSKALEKVTLLAKRMDWDMDFCHSFLQSLTLILYAGDKSHAAAVMKLVHTHLKKLPTSLSSGSNNSRYLSMMMGDGKSFSTSPDLGDSFHIVLKAILEDHAKSMVDASDVVLNLDTNASAKTLAASDRGISDIQEFLQRRPM